MRIALSTWTYAWAIGVAGSEPPHPMTAVQLIERAAALGVGAVQFADNLPLDTLDEAGLGEVERAAVDAGVAIEIGTRGVDREHLARCLAVAVRVGSPIVRVVIDRGDDRPTPAEAGDRLAESATAFREAGVMLAIENHDRYSTAELGALVRRLGDWAGICLDTVNSFGALEAPDAVVAALAPLAVNLHVKDFAIERVPWAMGFVVTGRAVGDGLLDVPALLDAVRATERESGRDITAVIELWTPPGDTVEDSIALESEWAERSVAALRGLGLR